MKNREVFLHDPVEAVLPNDGVARVGMPTTEQEWDVLRHELTTFVCEGAYQSGMVRILSTYLRHLDEDQQPAAWVSGFYGSGKSHFVRVLEYLWRDYLFPDGVTARGLTSGLPPEVRELLAELTTQGRRAGGLWSAAGTFGASAGDSVRMALLAIVLRAAGLPEQYQPARLALWLKHEGFYNAVADKLGAQGRNPNREFLQMYVSPPLHQAVREVYDGFGGTNAEVAAALREQFPRGTADITDDDFVRTVSEVLGLVSTKPGTSPLTLIVVDELQQYIGQDANRTFAVQEAVEPLQRKLQGKVLFVATGQSALTDTPQLQKLAGRFTVQVMLQDRDVETVVRQVVLQKKPAEVPDLRATLERVSGEIDRQLAGTKIGPESRDREELVPDYPLLPVRRRFWEAVLRAVDAAGTTGQLRTQLKIVLEATKGVAERPLGYVVAGDTIYGQLEAAMTMSGVLPNELKDRIQDLDDGTEDGRLRARLCGAIFLLGQMQGGADPDTPAATGVRATPMMLADLLVEDLNAGSGELRRRIPELLDGLEKSGTLMQVGDEYRLQTKESAEWEADFQRRLARIRNDEARIAGDLAAELKRGVTEALREVRLKQGTSGTDRKWVAHFGADPPDETTNAVPVWIRDEWSVTERIVRDTARASGETSAVVHVFLPKREPEALRTALARFAAAKDCVETRPDPGTPEGQIAKEGMQTRQTAEGQRVRDSIRDVLGGAKIFQDGGAEVTEASLSASVRKALEASLVRLYGNFGMADDLRWGTVYDRATKGRTDALEPLDWQGNANDHPVCREILVFLGATGKKGRDVRERFMGSGYGWPQDAVDGALVTLTACGFVNVTRDGRAQAAKDLTHTQIPPADFRSESHVITTPQRIQVRALLTTIGVPVTAGAEGERIEAALTRLEELSREAGGDPPLPERPSTALMDDVRQLSGNARFLAVYERRDELKDLMAAWQMLRDKARARKPRWELLQRLLAQASEVEEAIEVREQTEAIRSQRTLLSDPDPLAPLLERLSGALRSALQARRQRFEEALMVELSALSGTEEWRRLEAGEREAILREQSLVSSAAPQVQDDEALARELERQPLMNWDTRRAALSARGAGARAAAAKRAEPESVTVALPHGTLRTADDVADYLETLRAAIMAHIERGRPVIL